MPACTRLGDTCTGHGCWSPRGNDAASGDVYVNGIGSHRQSDHWPTHCCGPACHDSTLAAGSGSVYVNGLQMGRIGDPVACGSSVSQGSSNVFAGG